MSYTLCIIDMQQKFLNSLLLNDYDNIIDRISKDIKLAIKNNANIIFLEYECFGNTIKELLYLVRDYDKAYRRIKYDDDGSEELIDVLISNKINTKNIKFCGINTDCCVYSTVSGFIHSMKNSYNYEVLVKSCNSSWDHKAGIKKLISLTNKFDNLKVLT